MQVKLNTNLVPLFSGTYESIWEVLEVADDGEELEVDYDLKDLLSSIASVYQENAEYIKSELGASFIKSIRFDGGFNSPREYNFATDTLDFTLEINKAELIRVLKSLEGDQDFEKFLKDNYSSYDGFWSWTPNNYVDIRAEIWGEHEKFDQALGALITYLAKDNITSEGGTSIESMVFEDWQGNGYGGLDYKIVEPETV